MDTIIRLAQKGDIDALELEWMAAAEAAEPDWPDMLATARIISKKHDSSLAQSLVSYLLSAMQDASKSYEALKAVEQACSFLPESEELRMEYADIYRAVYGDKSWCEAALATTVENPAIALADALESLKKIENMPPGTYVREDPGARIGRVEAVAGGKGLEVSLEGRSKVIPVSSLGNLHPLQKDDIRALVLFERERIEALADTRPAELIRLVINTFDGRTGQNRISRYLKPAVGDGRWPSWWKEARKKADQAPDIGCTGGKNAQFFIRARPISRLEELKNKFDGADPSLQPGIALDIAGEIDKEQESEKGLLSYIAEELESIGRSIAGKNPVLAANSLAVLWRPAFGWRQVSGRSRKAPDWIETLDWPALMRGELRESPYYLDIIGFLPQWLPFDWSDVLMQSLPYLSQKGCKKATELFGGDIRDKKTKEAINAVLTRPDARLGALLWIWDIYKQAPEKKADELEFDGASLLRRILAAAAAEGRARRDRDKSGESVSNALKEAFSREGEDAVELAARPLDAAAVMALINLIDRNPGLNDYARKRLARAVRAARPELFRVSAPPWESDAIYTTKEGLARQKNIYEEIVNVKLPEIIKQVGEAAKFGDLSENAEYTAAMEERERLSRMADQIKEDLAGVRIISPDMPDKQHVCMGSRVRALDCSSERKQELIFLGPWDADPDAGIYAYNSPLGMAFMGAERGGKVVYQTPSIRREWKVLDIEPAHEFL